MWKVCAKSLAFPALQDVLGLGGKARMNLPASNSGNWLWRFRQPELVEDIAERLRNLTRLYGRAIKP